MTSKDKPNSLWPVCQQCILDWSDQPYQSMAIFMLSEFMQKSADGIQVVLCTRIQTWAVWIKDATKAGSIWVWKWLERTCTQAPRWRWGNRKPVCRAARRSRGRCGRRRTPRADGSRDPPSTRASWNPSSSPPYPLHIRTRKPTKFPSIKSFAETAQIRGKPVDLGRDQSRCQYRRGRRRQSHQRSRTRRSRPPGPLSTAPRTCAASARGADRLQGRREGNRVTRGGCRLYMEEMGFRVAASPSPPAMAGAEEEMAAGGRR